ncbi:MAG: PEP-utilizing protein mobile subunit [Actinobacteria bacterium]|nr:PEP-utilizing protein mobile subunit [Actinomycetota bacterium]
MADDPVHGRSAPTSYWSTSNLAEAMPGVLTPLGWSVWGPASELGARDAFYAMGAIPAAERSIPPVIEDRFINIFFGRPAARIDYLASIGDRMPGTSAEAIATQLLGSVPPGFVSRPTSRRYPFVALRLPRTFVAMPGVVRRARAGTDTWWRVELARTPGLDQAGARAQLKAGISRFRANVSIQGTALIACIQGVYDQLSRLATAAGVDSGPLMCGQGSHEETAVVGDLWAMSRGRLDLPTFLDRHGYHGPGEGEISGRVWREDPSPIEALLDSYRAMGDDADPTRAEALRIEERRRAEAALLAALPAAKRAPARFVLRLARTYLPLRGVGKVAFLQSLDVARAAARRLGTLLTEEGVLADPEDVFFLTVDELTGRPPADAAALVAERRVRHKQYGTLHIPGMFQGDPEAEVVGEADSPSRPEAVTVTGTAASPGAVEGRAVVVTDPAMADVEPGDILVAYTTDPSWASIMFLAKALVVDIGGVLSHAAVVARELGIPCVMGTRQGTRILRTGDICRVDGSAGTVEVLARAGESSTS